jgi:thiamine biosynthesis lipoprotein
MFAERHSRRASLPDSDWWTAGQFIVRAALLGPLLAAGLSGSGCQRPAAERLVSLSGQTMGTTYHIKYTAESTNARANDPAAVQQGIESLLAGIDRSMSTWREDSDISRFNASTSTDWFAVDGALVDVVAASEKISIATGGGFDITVKPLVDLWGFGSGGARASPPSGADIQATLPTVGFRLLNWRREPPALRKLKPSVRIEVAAIAPGYAVDRIVDAIKALGIGGGVVELGGEVRAWGRAPGDRHWRVGIERPDTSGDVEIQLQLIDSSLSTSGSYRNYLKYSGTKYSHEIDTRTGRPVDHRTVAVAVVAPTATVADGWSTALMVLGSADGLPLAARLGLAARFVDAGDGGPSALETADFARLLSRDVPD